MSVQVSYSKQFTLAIIFLLIIFASIEGIVRVYEFFFLPCRPSFADNFEHMNDFLVRQICTDIRLLQFEEPTVIQNKPNQHYATMNINDFGFRGPETTLEKPENTFRIIMIGGSTLFGHGASSDETTIPGYIQTKFNQEQYEVNIEVINAGVNSLYSFTETYHVENSLVKFKPDVIINYGGWNDADFLEENPTVKSTESENTEQKFRFRDYPFYRTPFMIFTLFFAEQYKEEAYDKVYNERANPPEKVVPLWKERWINACKIGNENGISTIIAIQPVMHTGQKPLTEFEERFLTDTEHDTNVIKNFEGFVESFNELDMVCEKTIDLRDVYDNVHEPIYSDKGHMTDVGNEIVADRLYEEIKPVIEQKIKN